MPLRDIVLKYVYRAFMLCLACTVFLIIMCVAAANLLPDINPIVYAAIFVVAAIFIMYAAARFSGRYIKKDFAALKTKMDIISERISLNEDFAAIITDVAEFDDMISEMQTLLARENLDFSEVGGEKKNIRGVFKLEYDEGRFVFSYDLADFLTQRNISVMAISVQPI